MSSRLLILPFFERLWEDEPPPNITDIALEVELGSRERSSRYLAFDGSRVAVATDTGIFIVHLDLSRGAERILSVGRVQELDRPHALEEVSCLQMSQTALWLTWQYPYPEPQGQGRTNFDELLDEEVSYHGMCFCIWRVGGVFNGLQSSTLPSLLGRSTFDHLGASVGGIHVVRVFC